MKQIFIRAALVFVPLATIGAGAWIVAGPGVALMVIGVLLWVEIPRGVKRDR